MGRLWHFIFWLPLVTSYVQQQQIRGDQEQDSSLVSLLSNKSPQQQQRNTRPQVADESNEDVPIQLPQASLLSQSAVNPAINPAQPPMDAAAQKREKERKEARVMNNPRPRGSNSFIGPHQASSEMEHGDSAPSDAESHNFQQTESLKHELERVHSKNDQTSAAYKISEDDSPTHSPRPFIKDTDIYPTSHKVEVENSEDLALVKEEQTMQSRLNFLQNKLKMRQKIKEEGRNELETSKLDDATYFRQPEAEMFKSARENDLTTVVTPDESKKQEPAPRRQAQPKYKLKRIDTERLSDDEIINSHQQISANASAELSKNFTSQTSSEAQHASVSTNSTVQRQGPIEPTPLNGPQSNKAFFSFAYDPDSPFGPPAWQILNVEWTCTARKQSPINIETEYLMDDTIVKNFALKTNPASRPLTGMLRNNGHAPTLSIATDMSVKIFGATLPNDYYLKQMHFHFGCDSTTGSEHHINGMAFPLELHLVFWDNSTYESFPDAAKADRGIVVLSVLYQVESIPDPDVKTSPMAQFTQLVRHIEEEGDNITVSENFDFRLERLIPNVMNPYQADKFFIYEGSLSTPGCYESVTWIVMSSHPPVTEAQLSVLRLLRSTKVNHHGNDMCNNYRPIQKKNGRRIYTNIIV